MSSVAYIVPFGEGLRIEPATGMVDVGIVCRIEDDETEGEA